MNNSSQELFFKKNHFLSEILSEYSEFIYFPSIDWDHSWERQQTLISHFCCSHSPIEGIVVQPSGLVEIKPFQLKKILILKDRIIKKNKDNKQTENNNPKPSNLVYVKPAFNRGTNRLFAGIAILSSVKLVRNLKPRGKRLVFASYVNPLVEMFLKTADFSILDLAERRQKNDALSKKAKAREKSWAAKVDLLVADNNATLNDYEVERYHCGKMPGVFIAQGFRKPVLVGKHVNNSLVAGYLGNLHDAIDYEYLAGLINNNRKWLFKVCGSIMSEKAKKILEFDNVKYCGVINPCQITEFLSDVSIGIIPYKRNQWTEGVFPTKLFEYLSHRIPVLSTSIPEVSRFRDSGFVQISDEAIHLNPPKVDPEEIDLFTQAHTWEARVKKYAEAIKLAKM